MVTLYAPMKIARKTQEDLVILNAMTILTLFVLITNLIPMTQIIDRVASVSGIQIQHLAFKEFLTANSGFKPIEFTPFSDTDIIEILSYNYKERSGVAIAWVYQPDHINTGTLITLEIDWNSLQDDLIGNSHRDEATCFECCDRSDETPDCQNCSMNN